jgi:acetate kinase
MNVLVINAGSSSLKYQLFNMDTKEVLAKGLCERIGIDGRLTHTNPNKEEKFSDNIPMKDHADAIRAVINILMDKEWGVIQSMSEIDAVGHRVVHGGEYFADSVLINDDVIKAIEACIPLAPLHNTPNLIGIDACKDVMGENIPQVAVFDTAFHQSMSQESYMYALPYEYYEKYKIRRYGFHGTSHKYVSKQASEMLGIPIENLRIVTCHLGNGSSITAIKGGKSMDTSMGFTPLDGLPMGTRAGNLDPAIISFLCEHEDKSAEEVIDILNKKSGMLGISGVSSDFRDLDTAINEGNPRAKLAKDMFILSVKKIIGSYIAEMGGVDAIVFTAGVGENDRSVRWDVCEHMEYLGIKVDPEKNKYRGRQMDISVDYARVRVLVIPTNEELVIAEDTKRLVEEAAAEA